MDRPELLALCRTSVQADVLIETISRLNCWPDDVLIEADAFDAPPDFLLAVAGVKKGRPKRLLVGPEGQISMPTGQTATPR